MAGWQSHTSVTKAAGTNLSCVPDLADHVPGRDTRPKAAGAVGGAPGITLGLPERNTVAAVQRKDTRWRTMLQHSR
jgi:hypothetical protein